MERVKTLYVSDLDGTLLQPDARLSDRAVELLNGAIADGQLFTIATARTPATVAPILERVDMRLPAIVMTGAALWDTHTHRYDRVQYMQRESAEGLLDVYRRMGTPTFVYTLADDMIDIYHIGEVSDLERRFIEERTGNPFKRLHTDLDSKTADELWMPGPGFDADRVVLFYGMRSSEQAEQTYGESCKVAGCRPQYYYDIFGEEVGIIEAFSDTATKALAVKALAEREGAERIVVFGDNINDLPMMQVADVAVAVENALPEVKAAADIVIGPNTADAVAEFISLGFRV